MSIVSPTPHFRSDFVAQSVDPIGRMDPYGPAHLAALVATVVLAILLVIAARRLRRASEANANTALSTNDTKVSSAPNTSTAPNAPNSSAYASNAEQRALTIAGWIMLIATLLWMTWNMLPLNWNIDQSLPFHLSDALRIVTAIALLTRSSWSIAITYYWGLTLNLQSVITPDLNYFHAPGIEYTAYWFFHIVALVTPVVFVWGLGYRPTWRGYGVTLCITAAWAGIAAIANALTGANYMYLARAPEGPSILDLLGPWPAYLLWEGLIIASVWALITWPWTTKRLRGAAFGRFGLISRGHVRG